MGGQTQFLTDPTGALSLDELRHPGRARHWETNHSDTLNLGGAINTVYWFRWNLSAPNDLGPLLLDTGTVWMGQAQLFVMDGDKLVETQWAGMDIPREQRNQPDDQALFSIHIPPGQQRQVYLRVQSVFAVLLIPRLVPPVTLSQELTFRSLILGAYMGLVGVMLAYNLILGWFLRDKKYGWYVAYSLAFGACASIVAGAGHALFLTRPSPAMSHLLGLLFMASGFLFPMLGLQFTRAFFEAPQTAPRLNRWLVGWQAVGALGLVAGLIIGTQYGLFVMDLYLLPTHLLFFGVAVWFWRQRARAARYFVIAQVPELLGVFITGLTYTGMLAPTPFTLHGMEWGSALEILLFSLALADRYTLIRQEKETALKLALANEALAVKRLEENDTLREAKKQAEEARDKAEAATRLKDKFVSLVAHDMRSPFSSIMLYAQTLEESQDPPLPPHQKEMATVIRQRGQQFTHMVDELLTLNRLQTGKITLEPKPFSVKVMVDEVFLVKQLADDKQVRLFNQVADGVEWNGDRRLLHQVVQNLLMNAIKFSHPGGHITVYCPDDLTLSVRDNGVGVEAALKPHLFNPEVKTTTPGTAGEVGTGLGLPLCQEIMSAHGGRLWVESNPDGGSIFSLSLPQQPVIPA